MNITIHRGTQEIGGSCVQVTSQGYSLLLDAGSPLGETSSYVDLAQIDFDAVLVSHSHQDHYGLIDQVDSETPVYIGEIGSKMVASARVSLINSIIYNNAGTSITSHSVWRNPTRLNVGWSNIEGGVDGLAIDSTVSFNWLEGNINEDPVFVGGESYSYYLKPESPCIDAGTDLFVFEGDTIVNYSPEEYNGLAPDMGAFGINLVDFLEENGVIPDQFQLYQNYPNPFNNTTTISYQLPEAGSVNLSIYNISGQLVEVLENGRKPANSYKVRWDAGGYASGIYFVRLSAGRHTAINKMLLVK